MEKAAWRGISREYNGNQNNLAIGNLSSAVLRVSPLLSPAGEQTLKERFGGYFILKL